MCLSGEITPTEEAALLDTEAGEEVPVLCEHWLLDPQDGCLRPEDDINCPKCSKTWKSLLPECFQQETPANITAYCCSTGDGMGHYLVLSP